MIRVLIANVIPDHLRRHFIAHTADEISRSPQLPCPQSFPQLWKLFKHLACRDAFHNLHYLRWCIARCHLHKHMHMFGLHSQLIDLPFIFLSDPSHCSFNKLSYIAFQYLLAILGGPYKMVLQIVDRVSSSLDRTHIPILVSRLCHASSAAFIPAASCEASCGY